jgi:hypothetical protein
LTAFAPDQAEVEPSPLPYDALALLRIKNEVAMRLLQAWLTDESGYDESAWELVKNSIEENQLSNRNRFDE